jgi:hypothetical protein
MKIDDFLPNAARAAVLVVCLVLGACSERMNREDFELLVKGKGEQHVLINAGKPASTDNTRGNRHVWTYTSRTFDVQKANKVDAKTTVVFTPGADGKMVVSEVKFE